MTKRTTSQNRGFRVMYKQGTKIYGRRPELLGKHMKEEAEKALKQVTREVGDDLVAELWKMRHLPPGITSTTQLDTEGASDFMRSIQADMAEHGEDVQCPNEPPIGE